MSSSKGWRLPELLRDSGIRFAGSVPDVPVTRVTDDSRAVEPGTLFVAVRGTKSDGHRFLLDAVRRGAIAVVLEDEEEPLPAGVARLKVPSTRSVLGPLVHRFLGSPSERLKMVGITGTNGKTTVAWLVHHVLQSAGIRCGLLGTVCYKVGSVDRPSVNTTPGVVSLQGMLAQMQQEGARACSMEVSSHALDQHRTDGIRWSCGIFTNLSPEHMDYHRTIEQYLQAKLKLFQALDQHSTAVINRDDPVWGRVRSASRGKILLYSTQHEADITARDVRLSFEGTACELVTPEGAFQAEWGLIGKHNIENLLAAVGAGIAVGVPVKEIVKAASAFAGVPGRLEKVEAGQPFPVFVDYAHTDGALRSVLQQLRAVSKRKIMVVFGCGGDRDRTKRPRMGRVAVELADRVIITSDNPRTEDPWAIAQEVAAGADGSATPCGVVLDRREAIRLALESCDRNWLLLIAGKGHEAGQVVGAQTFPFDDRVVAREFLGGGSPLKQEARR